MESVRLSGLFTDQELHDLLYLVQAAGLHLADNKGVATWCVQQGYLTTFQAKQLLAGKWRNFIINNKYKVLEPLGQGGMGAVFRCAHMTLDKEVAMKVLPSELTANNPDALRRFLREARALAALDHPNIVQAHDVDENRGQYFIIMSCVEGRTLLDIVRKDGPLAPGQAADYICQACRGLQHAHEAGWVHRDLKPGNLILDCTGTVKITDFGLARLESSEGSVTRHDGNSIVGSPDYISPEQAMNKPQIDIRADIYSLGATLYFFLTGRGPFEGEPLLQKLLAHQMRDPEEVSFFRSDIPEGMSTVLKKMMAKNPDDRYATPREVEEALAPFAKEPWTGKAPSTTNRARSGRTLRVPRVKATLRAKVAVDPLDTSATPVPFTPREITPLPVTATVVPPPPEEPEEAAEGLSATTKRWLAIGVAAAVLLGVSLFLYFWLTATPDRETQLVKADRLGKQGNWPAAAQIYAELLRTIPEGSKERKEVYSRINAGKKPR
jgi:serine/threonine protein kinase